MSVYMLLLFGATLFGHTLGGPLCGLESCNELQAVKACGTLNTCISQVWEKRKSTGDRDDICSICLKMVKEARDQLESNETTSELKQVLEGSCELMILKPAVKVCKNLADEFVPELVAMLASQMDPETVCTVAKLCNNDFFHQELEYVKECAECQNFVVPATEVIKNMSTEDFGEETIRFCQSMGSFSDACLFYALDFFDLHPMMTLALEQSPCQASGVCRTGMDRYIYSPTPLSSVKEATRKMCASCPAAMKNLKKLVTGMNSNEEFALRAFELCKAITSDKERCSQLTGSPSSWLYDYLTNIFDPEYFCKHQIEICGSSSRENIPVWPLLPASAENNPKIIFGRVGLVDFQTGVQSSDSERPKISFGDSIDAPLLSGVFLTEKDDSCESCQGMFSQINELVSNDHSFMEYIVKPACQEIPDFSSCESLVQAWQKFFKSFTSDKVCSELVPSCSVGEKVHPSEAGVCRFCLRTMDSLSSRFDGEDSLKDLQKTLLEKCEEIPELTFRCQTLLTPFGSQLLKGLSAKLFGDDSCSHLNLCSSNSAASTIANPCRLCILTVKTLYDELLDNRNEEKVKKALENVCKYLPKKMEENCGSLVDQYTDELIRLVEAGLSPAEVCKKINLCFSESNFSKPLISSSTSQPEETAVGFKTVGKISCKFCVNALKVLLQQLQNTNTEEEIRKALDSLCKYMPEETQDTCRSLIDQYTEDIIDMVVADFSADEICMYLKLCGPHPQPQDIGAFDIRTNEIHDEPKPVEACQHCRILESSMINSNYEDTATKALLTFLVDNCLMNEDDLFVDCRQTVGQQLLPFDRKVFYNMTDVCGKFRVCNHETQSKKFLLERFHTAVQECALCETLTQIISHHKKMLSPDFSFPQHATSICAVVTSDKESMCKTMLISYGPSIVNLLKREKVRPERVCSVLQLCDEDQQTKVNMPVSKKEPTDSETADSTEDCMKGPQFWCANLENAKKCGTILHCQEVVWRKQELTL